VTAFSGVMENYDSSFFCNLLPFFLGDRFLGNHGNL
jgi:hypothetical protein